MEFLKELFGEKGLTFDEFCKAAGDKGLKLADLSSGAYVSKTKYDDDILAKDEQIKTLNSTLTTRDTDLSNIQKQLESAGNEKEKLSAVSAELSTLQEKYETETKQYQQQLTKQAYEFAVKEFANGKKFTSNAAKRDFINSLTKAELKMDNGAIMGAEDFVTKYTADNADAFVAEKPTESETLKPPTFAAPTGNGQSGGETANNPFNFHFAGVRIKKE